MKKVTTVEEAIHEGYNYRKVKNMAKEELGESATERKINRRVEQARKNLEK